MPCSNPSSTSNRKKLVPILRELRFGLLVNFGVLLCLRELSSRRLLSLIVCSPLDLSPLLQSASKVSLNCRTRNIQGNRKPQTSRLHPGISIQPRDSVYRQCSISSLASISTLSTLVGPPFSSSYRMVVEHLRRP